MRSAALPDLNTGYNTYRKQILMSLSSGNYDLALGYLYSLNAILPDDYKIEISSIKYNELKNKETIVANCKFCKNPCEHKDMKVNEVLLSSSASMLTGLKFEKMWSCPKCHKDNRLSTTDFEHQILPKPHYLKVLPNPPEKKNGLVESLEYNKIMKSWIQTFAIELEHAMSKYRLEYVPKGEREEYEEVEDMRLEDYE